MNNVLFNSTDLASVALAAGMLGCLTVGGICIAGLSWTSDRWRVNVALAGIAVLISAFAYNAMANLWLTSGALSSGLRYAVWYSAQPALVVAAYFFARNAGPVPSGVFWRLLAASILMVFTRHLGDAGIFSPSLGALLSIAFWLYILGELYFGAISEAVSGASRAIRVGFFWIRLIMTVGWAMFPILHFVDVVIGTGHVQSIIVLYTIMDIINLLAIALIHVGVAGQERY